MQANIKVSPAEAAYRTALKRMCNAAGLTNYHDLPTIELEYQIKAISTYAPGIASRGLDKLAERFDKSLNQAFDTYLSRTIRDAKSEDAKRCKAVVNRLCALFDIGVNWTGAYPSFTVKGHCYHDALSAIRASVQNEVH